MITLSVLIDVLHVLANQKWANWGEIPDFDNVKYLITGYQGVYQQRTGGKEDGCSIIYNKEKFSREAITGVEYLQKKYPILDRDNVGLIVKLKPVNSRSKQALYVANTHLLYNPRRGDIKLAQLMLLLAEIDRMSHTPGVPTSPSAYSPIILCGDFNSTPKSDIYRFLTRGHLRYEDLVISDISGQKYNRGYKLLDKEFFPKELGISDQCQHVELSFHRAVVSKANPFSRSVPFYPKTNTNLNEFGQLVLPGRVGTSNVPNQSSDKCSISDGVKKNLTEVPVTSAGAINVPRDSNNVAGSSSASSSQVVSKSSQSDDATSHSNSGPSQSESVPSISDAVSSAPYMCQNSGYLWHQLNLESVYKHRIERLGYKQREVTTQHDGEGTNVDYIFYNVCEMSQYTRHHKLGAREGSLKLLGRLGLMSSDEIAQLGNLPNDVNPSDHLPLLARFLLE